MYLLPRTKSAAQLLLQKLKKLWQWFVQATWQSLENDQTLKENTFHRITELYTRWTIGEEEHDSERQPIPKSQNYIAFNDHHAIPLPYELVSNVMAGFYDADYEVQVSISYNHHHHQLLQFHFCLRILLYRWTISRSVLVRFSPFKVTSCDLKSWANSIKLYQVARP